MATETDDVRTDLATAFGVYALSDASLHEAASAGGVTQWELEAAIEDAGLAEVFGLDDSGDVAGEIDELLDDDS